MPASPQTVGPTLPNATDSAAPAKPLRLSAVLTRFQPTPDSRLLGLALLIGTGAGLGVVTFRYLIHLVNQLMLGRVAGVLSVWGHWTLALLPILGGLLVGGLRWGVQGFGPGLSALMETVQGGKELAPLKPVSKMVAAAVSLGSGASLGPEGPSVEIGANFSLLLGQALKVSQARQLLLLGAGAAAGLAAGFNAPIAGVFFALEVVLGSLFAPSSASVVLLSAVVAAWIAQIGLGAKPAFALPAYEVRSLLELPLYVGLGVFASLVSILYRQAMAIAQQAFQGQLPGTQWLAKIPNPLHPVLGGIAVGAVALWFPQILGVGYETIESILQDVQFPLRMVIALLGLKLVMTAVSFGSGFVGGVFAPALFLGASLGLVYGKTLAIALPVLHPYMASPPAYAMVGMAAVLAGSVRAPLTSILLLFELTQDYRIILPLMSAVGLSIWLVETLQPTKLMDSDGEQQEAPEETIAGISVPASLLVVDALQPIALKLSANLLLAQAARTLIDQRATCALVMDNLAGLDNVNHLNNLDYLGGDETLVGILTLRDINRLILKAEEDPDLLQRPIRDLCTTHVLFAYSDETVKEAIARMGTRGLHQIPVVERDHPTHVIGLLTEESITTAARLARITKTLGDSEESSEDFQADLAERNGKAIALPEEKIEIESQILPNSLGVENSLDAESLGKVRS